MKSLILICAVGMAFGQNRPAKKFYPSKECVTVSMWELADGGFWPAPDTKDRIWTYVINTRAELRHIEDCDYVKMSGKRSVSVIGQPESLDVPAIQETVESWKCFDHWEGCSITDTKGAQVSPEVWFAAHGNNNYLLHRHTCKDKNRILEHDEQDPPKYWCRKVQN